MSRLVRHLFCAAAAAGALSASAGAQLLGPLALPPVGVPVPQGNLPIAGPLLQNVLNQPAAQQAIRPTLDSVGGLTETIAQSGPATLLDLRRIRLDNLISSNRTSVESDGTGLPVRRGIIALLDPDAVGLQAAIRAGFRILADDREPQLELRVVSLTVPSGMIPPKMLTRMPFTAGSLRMILNAAVTFSLLAPPPTSRKLAGNMVVFATRS